MSWEVLCYFLFFENQFGWISIFFFLRVLQIFFESGGWGYSRVVGIGVIVGVQFKDGEADFWWGEKGRGFGSCSSGSSGRVVKERGVVVGSSVFFSVVINGCLEFSWGV